MDEQGDYVNCVICGQDATKVFMDGSGPARVVKCRNDGLVYRNPRPSVGYIKEYQSGFVMRCELDWYELRQRTLRKQASAIQKIKRGGKLLDIGCGTGVFFENFKNGNWRLYGVDPSSLGVELAQSKYGAEVSCGTLRDTHYPSGTFDLVTIMDAFYYSPNPKADLAEIRRILKDDGLLAVEIPGHSAQKLRDKGLICFLLDGKWVRHYANLGQLYYFSPPALRLLLEAAGFRVVEVVPGMAVTGRAWGQVVHRLHFEFARLVHKASAGRLSLAARELYLAVKAH
jgi:SAM-dependent methyltransferase